MRDDAESVNNDITDISAAVEVLKKHGGRRIGFCISAEAAARLTQYCPSERIAIIPDLKDSTKLGLNRHGWDVHSLSEVPADIDAIVIVDRSGFRQLYRNLEPLARRDCLILPADRDWVVPQELRSGDAMYTAWNTTSAVNYVARCNLKGHYLEFGVFWGSSFFTNYFRFRHWLRGTFYAIDSFHGLSTPDPQETEFTGGDFLSGAYCSNQRSFLALADFLEVLPSRLCVVPGYFKDSIHGVSPSRYNLEPGSVSVCYIDCDLKEPTDEVLAFVTPLLERGGLIYFDDWRLCRGSRDIGERAAVMNWLEQNPSIELIEFDRDHWQHQWFIFQRR